MTDHPAKPSEGVEVIQSALATYDAKVAECPVRTSGKFLDKCPRCRSGPTQNCGIDVGASYTFVETVRAALSEAGGE